MSETIDTGSYTLLITPERRIPFGESFAAEMPPVGSIILDPNGDLAYRIKGYITKRGPQQSSILKALDMTSGKTVVLKIYENIQFFESEWSAWNKVIPHPNILEPVSFFQDGNILVLELPFVSHTWVGAIGEADRHAPSWSLALLHQLASALARIHSSGVVHGDIKPANVLIDGLDSETAITKVIDFGIALETGGFARIIGENRFSPPEVRDEGIAGPPTDTWGWGIMAYYLLKGKEPWPLPRVRNADLKLRSIEQGCFIRDLALRLTLSELVEAALNPDPLRRPKMQHIVQSLERIRPARESVLHKIWKGAVSCFTS